MPSGKVDETSGAMRADRKGLAICKEFTSRGKIVRMDMEGQKNVFICTFLLPCRQFYIDQWMTVKLCV